MCVAHFLLAFYMSIAYILFEIMEANMIEATLEQQEAAGIATISGSLCWFPPRLYLDKLLERPDVRALYETKAGIWEKGGDVRILEHTENALQVLEKYPIPQTLREQSLELTPRLFAMILTLHDLGKHLPDGYAGPLKGGRDKSDQHERTLQIIRALQPVLGLSNHEQDLMETIIGNDEMGSFFRKIAGNRKPPIDEDRRQKEDFRADGSPIPSKKEIESAFQGHRLNFNDYHKIVDDWEELIAEAAPSLEEIQEAGAPLVKAVRSQAQRLGIDSRAFFKFCTLYFQCDVRAYTADTISAGPSLDYLLERDPRAESYDHPLFVFMPEKGRFRFSTPLERAYKVLESAFEQDTEVPSPCPPTS